MKIRIAVYGYGNLGKGVESAVAHNPDMELKYVFTRRDPAALRLNTPGAVALPAEDARKYKDEVDVMILCGGSATDLPVQTPLLAKDFNVIDSFDTHARIPEHFAAVNGVCKNHHTVGLISAGWDPGLFSVNRVMAEAVLPGGNTYTFWGKGVSQGHSDAIRRIEGVLDARQYTVPCQDALSSVRKAENPVLTTRQKHTRECYVVAAEGADREKIRHQIVTMPNYFADYDTTVHFISMEELKQHHAALPHGGFVIHSANSGMQNENSHVIAYSLKLDSNPEFTSSAIAAYARAVYRLAQKKDFGCKTVLDVAPALMSPLSYEELLAHCL